MKVFGETQSKGTYEFKWLFLKIRFIPQLRSLEGIISEIPRKAFETLYNNNHSLKIDILLEFLILRFLDVGSISFYSNLHSIIFFRKKARWTTCLSSATIVTYDKESLGLIWLVQEVINLISIVVARTNPCYNLKKYYWGNLTIEIVSSWLRIIMFYLIWTMTSVGKRPLRSARPSEVCCYEPHNYHNVNYDDELKISHDSIIFHRH